MHQRGFTLIELLIAVAIIGIIAAVAMGVLTNAVHRSRQAGTMSDMRTVATAITAYQIDLNRYPIGSTVSELIPYLVPEYAKFLPSEDGWGRAMAFSVDAEGASYTLRSYGKDGMPDATYNRGAVHSFDDDITHVDGNFVQWPEGAQQ